MTIPIAPIAGLAAGLVGPLQQMMNGDWLGGLNKIGCSYTGFNAINRSFDVMDMKDGVLPLVVGLAVHRFVGGRPINANATLARAKVPLIRI
jgi:hypothetical protein